MRTARAALLALALLSAPALAQDCAPFTDMHLQRLIATGLEVEVVEGDALKSFMAALAAHVSLADVVEPVKLVIVFTEQAARISVIAEAGLCNVISGPPAGVRAMLKAARGQPI